MISSLSCNLFIDLPIENYIERSLYYQRPSYAANYGHMGVATFGIVQHDDAGYICSTILREVIDKQIKFKTPNDLRQYLAETHDTNKTLYYEAMDAETAELTAAIKRLQHQASQEKPKKRKRRQFTIFNVV